MEHLPFLNPTHPVSTSAHQPTLALHKGIALVGLPRSGKTTVGQLMAKTLHWRFIDSDAQIAQSQGLRIPELIAQRGIETFRQKESQWLRALCTQTKASEDSFCVLSTGGGLPCHDELMVLLNQHFVTVHLTLDVDTWLKRLFDPPHEMSQRLDRKALSALYDNRQPVYTQAQFTLSQRSTVEKDVENLLRAIWGPSP